VAGARNQLASHQAEFFEIASIEAPHAYYEGKRPLMTFESSLSFVPLSRNESDKALEMKFNAGDFVLVRGETGVGKTTLLKEIGGLGTFEFKVIADGNNFSESESWRPSASLVSQSPFLYGENLIEVITGAESNKEIDIDLLAECLRISCLETWDEGQPRDITNEKVSGGERKQIALARAIYSQPQILLLDEVTAGLDQKLAEKIIGNLRNCQHFKLIVLASHDLLSEENFDQVIILK
jgi:ABC-type transport system involved in cytochrome bd biosynthesis fused ATPase/permease subunit